MYLRILKKDLKRKKTMNVILLLFIVLSAMFAASSVNNIITVVGGIDSYLEKANVSDYFLISRDSDGKSEVEDVLSGSGAVKGFRAERGVLLNSSNLTTDGEKLMDFGNIAIIQPIGGAELNYFDPNNNTITEVERGKAYITGSVPRRDGLEKGTDFTVSVGGAELRLEFKDFAKDAFLGSDFMNNPRIFVNDEDYEELVKDEEVKKYSLCSIFYVDTDDEAALESELTNINGILFNGGRQMIKTSYIMNMLVAAMILVISIGLIIVSFVVLRFTIGFTIAEEFREIGVMKAVGLKNRSIRGLYLVKYLGLALVGSAIGFFLSLPFGSMLLSSVSENMVLESSNGASISILCCLGVVGLIMLFSWRCTKRIKKLSPIDAVRSGQTGERFKKRGLMHLGKSRLGSTGFLAANDVLSAPKQYGIIAAVFAVCSVIIMILSVTANTLNSDKLLYLLAVQESDVYLNETSLVMDVMSGSKTLEETKEIISNKLDDNGMSADIRIETWFKLPVDANGKSTTVTFMQCRDTEAADYYYSEGSAPKDAHEIAITNMLAEKLGVKLGDKIKIDINGTQEEFLITAFFHCFNNLGEMARLHQDIELPDTSITSAFAYQLTFRDDPGKKEIDSRIEKLKDIFDSKEVFDSQGFVNDCTGVSEMIAGVKNMALVISLIIVVMIAVLMERSFISKEKSEIALMKAMGFKSRSVIAQHTLRFTLAVAAAEIIAAVIYIPLTKLIMNPIMGIMGATGRIDYRIDPLEQLVLYPLIILAATALAAALTALYTRTIQASDTSNIE